MRRNHYLAIPRRRRQGKTDYRKRRGIVMGKDNFLTVGISNKHIYGQIHRVAAQGDQTICSFSSGSLSKLADWKGSAKNISSAYLTGYVLGKRALERKLTSVVYYSGIGSYIHGSRIASVMKGAKDAGLDIRVDEETLPPDERVKGVHISDYAKSLESEDKNAFNRFFSKILASGLNPKDYPEHFETVRKSIGSKC
jgi:large subunit ribosomal protein L18